MASWKAKITFRHNGAAEQGGQGGGVGQARCVHPAPPSSRPTLPACAPLFAKAPQRGSPTPPSPSTLPPAPSPLTGHCSSRPLGDILGQAGFRAQIWKGRLGEDAPTEPAPPPGPERQARSTHARRTETPKSLPLAPGPSGFPGTQDTSGLQSLWISELEIGVRLCVYLSACVCLSSRPEFKVQESEASAPAPCWHLAHTGTK